MSESLKKQVSEVIGKKPVSLKFSIDLDVYPNEKASEDEVYNTLEDIKQTVKETIDNWLGDMFVEKEYEGLVTSILWGVVENE